MIAPYHYQPIIVRFAFSNFIEWKMKNENSKRAIVILVDIIFLRSGCLWQWNTIKWIHCFLFWISCLNFGVFLENCGLKMFSKHINYHYFNDMKTIDRIRKISSYTRENPNVIVLAIFYKTIKLIFSILQLWS